MAEEEEKADGAILKLSYFEKQNFYRLK